MILRFFFIIISLPTILFAQKNNIDFKREIIFNHYTEIANEEPFNESLNILTHKIDSLLTLRDGINEWSSINTSSLRLQFDPRESNNDSPIKFKYTYTDKSITTKYYRHNKESNYFKIINNLTQTVNTYSSKDSTLIKENIKYSFNNYINYTVEEFRNDIKNIHGYKCFRVLIKELDNRIFDSISIQDIYPNSFIYKEMYVTENIKSLYHSMSFDKKILEKYFPLEVKTYSDVFKGKTNYVTTESIIE